MSVVSNSGAAPVPQSLRALIIEDSPADAQLVVAKLKSAGFSVTHEVVDGPMLLQRKLQHNKYDIVLSDHDMVTWTGMDALAIVQQLAKDTPFIVVSGLVGDVAAVEYIKQGGTDYVLKDHLERLPLVVNRALQEQANREGLARSQAEILTSQKEWEITFNAVTDMVLLLDEDCHIRRANHAVPQFLNVKLPTLIDKPCYEVFCKKSFGGTGTRPQGCPRKRMEESGQEETGEIFDPASGHFFEVTLSPLPEQDGIMKGSVCIIRDVTERRKGENLVRESEAALRRSQQELRALNAQLISLKEEESSRLARELHDVFSQRLAMLGMEVSALQQQLASSPLPATDRLRLMGDEIRRLAQDAHQMSRQLHPAVLDDLGLTAALQSECALFSKQRGIPTKFRHEHVPQSLKKDISLSLYRIVQESLWNAGKHAKAKELLITLISNGKELVLAVQDDGKGFDPDQIKGGGGLGLVSMKERALLVRGTFSFQSRPGEGTRIEVRVPLPKRPE